MRLQNGTIRSAIIGYGGEFNMGKHHALEMKNAGIELTAVCDINPDRAAEAARDFPAIRTYTSVEELLSQPDIDLVTVITPHHTHADLASAVLEHGKHCILEKPMCIHADDASRLTRLAHDRGLMLSVYHNRRWDGWYLTVQDLVSRGQLGDIFYAEFYFAGFDPMRDWWRSDKAVSGGAFYDWGAHYVDWTLGLIPSAVRSVRGYAQKRLWHGHTNEDQLDGLIEFENGAVVHAQASSIAHAGRGEERILGTRGAVTLNRRDDYLTLHTQLEGNAIETRVPIQPSRSEAYYLNIAAHLRLQEALVVQPEQARRVIAVLEAITLSAERREPLTVPYESGAGAL
ncbi:Gfo/Idh/MocA family protein [Cohnella sp. GCM10012308]|uniref:Gfo/Idh/MocA family protein n=1 Tax=Cohnella sp. GCM10012308 TaxID=3317329 RepID=UPI003609BCC2